MLSLVISPSTDIAANEDLLIYFTQQILSYRIRPWDPDLDRGTMTLTMTMTMIVTPLVMQNFEEDWRTKYLLHNIKSDKIVKIFENN